MALPKSGCLKIKKQGIAIKKRFKKKNFIFLGGKSKIIWAKEATKMGFTNSEG